MNSTDGNEIQHIIISLQRKNIFCYYNFSQLYLKLFGKEIALPLAILINRSIVKGIVPQDLKIAKSIYVFKSKPKDDISNYRPMSIFGS